MFEALNGQTMGQRGVICSETGNSSNSIRCRSFSHGDFYVLRFHLWVCCR